MRRILAVLSAVTLSAVLLGGCGSNAGGIPAGLVVGEAGAEESYKVSGLTAGIESFGQENSLETRIYTASSNTLEGYKVQFDAAAQDNAAYVVCEGEEMEIPVFEAQNEHHGQKFLFFEGMPRQSEDVEAVIRSNTMCLHFSRADIGFLAGYVAVCDGYRNLFYMSGKKDEEKTEYYQGFLSGVAYAIQEHSLTPEMVSVSVEYADSDQLTPLRMTEAMAQYDAGVDLILTDTPGISPAIEQAAKARDKHAATIGFNRVDQSDVVVFSSMADWKNAVQALLTSVTKDKGFAGGQTAELGGAQRAVTIRADYSRLQSFTEAALENIIEAMEEGSAAAVTEKSETNADGTSSYAPPIQVTEVSPMSPDGEAGLHGSTAVSPEAAADSGQSETESSAGSDAAAETGGEEAPAQDAAAETGGEEDTAQDEASDQDEDEADAEDEAENDGEENES